MPRLGEDPNVATAYPNQRVLSPNGYLRQFVKTALSSLLVLFILHKVFFTEYRPGKSGVRGHRTCSICGGEHQTASQNSDMKEATKAQMSKRGISGERIAKFFPDTKKEIASKKEEQKITNSKKITALEEQVGNLTYSVSELQQALVNSTGATLKHPVILPNVTLNAVKGENIADAVPVAVDGEGAGQDPGVTNAQTGDGRRLMTESAEGMMRGTRRWQRKGWNKEGESWRRVGQRAP